MKCKNPCWNGEQTMMMNDWLGQNPAILEQCRRKAGEEVRSCPVTRWPLEWGNSELEAVVYRMGENLHDKMQPTELLQGSSIHACLLDFALELVDWQQIAGVYLGAEWAFEPITLACGGTAARTTPYEREKAIAIWDCE